MLAALVGGGLSYLSQKGTNATNVQMQREANAHNAKLQKDTNDLNQRMAREAMAFSGAQSAKQMDFQKEMSNTSYQRSMADMKAAGLNPMLAFSQGGASSPGGAAGSGQSVAAQAATMQAAEIENEIGKGISSAMDIQRYQKELKAVDSQVALNKAAGVTQAAQATLNANSAKVAEINAKALQAQMPAIKAQANYDEKKANIDAKMVKYDAVSRRVGEGVGIINDAASVIKPKFQFGGSNDQPRWIPRR